MSTEGVWGGKPGAFWCCAIASEWLLLHKTSVCPGAGALSCNFTDLNCALSGGRIALLLTTIWLRRISIAAVLGVNRTPGWSARALIVSPEQRAIRRLSISVQRSLDWENQRNFGRRPRLGALLELSLEVRLRDDPSTSSMAA